MQLTIQTLTKFILFVSLGFWLVSFFQKDRLPDKSAILPELYQAPLQTETEAEPFQIKRKGVAYKITPLQEYELYGLAVSENDFRDFWEKLHEDWNDHINVKDLCVVWGPNVESDVYQKVKYRSGEFTCYLEAKNNRDRTIWTQFKLNALSNNHLLSDRNDILKKISQTRKGDQIHFKGYLVEYISDSMYGPRKSSLIREDNGCEVIYLTHFEILKKANRFWHFLFLWSGRAAFACLVLLVSYFIVGIGKEVKRYREKINRAYLKRS
jgi:hypothetical protein